MRENTRLAQSFPDLELLEWMRTIRRTLHQNPELGYQEHFTSAYIQEKLGELQAGDIKKVAGTGVIVSLGTARKGQGHVALRADMDALPLQDAKTVAYHSRIPHVMHACGHDGHVAMLLGAISILKGCDLPGRVTCIFQPAEEHGNGAQKVIEEGGLDKSIQAIFAGHIDTHFPTGVITVDAGIICSFADPFSIIIKGHGGHAARPHEAKDALVAGAFLVTGLQTLVSRQTDPNEAGVVTVGRFDSGHAHNIIPGEAHIDGTIRSTNETVRNALLAGLQRMARGIEVQYQVEVEVRLHDSLPAVINSEKAYSVAKRAAIDVAGREQVCSQHRPSLGGEDFAFYQKVVDGCLVRFGADSKVPDCPAHSATFDFDEGVLSVGAAWLARVALQWLTEHEGSPDSGK